MFDLISGSDLQHLIAAYGYMAVFLIIAVESMGIPVPGEMTLMAASIYAGTTHHLLIGMVITAAIAGAIAGDNVGYLVGKKGGFHLLHRYGRYVRLDESRLQLGQYLFHRHGGTMVFAGRFLPVLRIWAGFLAGSLSMPWRRFLVFNAAGGATWATLMGLGAYTFGQSAVRAGGLIGLAIGALAIVLMVGVMLGVQRTEHRIQREADSNCSGPEPVAA
jgi:membrane protein DedA with SNARE-associated domain